MKSPRRMGLAFALYLAAGIYGCSTPPDQELNLCQQARNEAKEEHAAEFAPGDWKNAEDLFQQAQGLIAKKSYGQARNQLLRAKDRFRKAHDVAKGKRDDLLRETQSIQKTVDLRYASLKASIENSSDKLSAARKKSLKDARDDIDNGIEKLKAELEQGDYISARTTAQKTMRKVYEAEVELQGYLGVKKQP